MKKLYWFKEGSMGMDLVSRALDAMDKNREVNSIVTWNEETY